MLLPEEFIMVITSLFLTVAMCIPVGGRKEIVSNMHTHLEKISYLSGEMAGMIEDEELLSLWNKSDEKVKNAFFRKTLIDREEKLGILGKDIACDLSECYARDDEELYCVKKLENAFFGDTIASSGIMYEYDDNCTAFLGAVEKADSIEEEKPAEKELEENGCDYIGDIIKNYFSGPFPIYDCNPEKAQVVLNGTYDGDPFVGLRLSQDACISFVNGIDSFLNDCWSAATGFGLAAGTLKAFSAVMPSIEAYMTGVALNVGCIETYLNSILVPLWSKICAFFTTNPIGIVIGVILAIIAIVTIYLLVEVFICGLERADYINGIVIHGWFNFEYVHTNIYNQSLPNPKPVVFA